MRRHYYRPQRNTGGFSLIEVMVGMVVGVLGILVMLQVYAIAEGQKRTTTTGSDAHKNGLFALYSLERDVRMAGYGIADSNALGCPVSWTTAAGAQTPFVLVPVDIAARGTDNAIPDTIKVLYSDSPNAGLPITITKPPGNSANLRTSNEQWFSTNDFVMLYETGMPCAMMRITDIPGSNQAGVVIHSPGQSQYNSASNSHFPTTYSLNATVLNFGTLIDFSYQLDANNRLEAFSVVDNTREVVAEGVVALRAQYGYDADQNGALAETEYVNGGTAVVWPRVYAVRVALLVRSQLREKPNAAGACDITTAAMIQRDAPDWAETHFVARVQAITPNDWGCYRYFVYQSVIPLRNLIWADK